MQSERRRFLSLLCLGTVGIAAGPRDAQHSTPAAVPRPDISFTEDLMRSHRLLDRVLLIYDEAIRRLSLPRPDLPPDVVGGAARIVHRLAEKYHQQLEEGFLFPPLRRARVLVDLVDTLEAQHRQVNRLTWTIEQMATPDSFQRLTDRQELVEILRAFSLMYRAHEAHEDTVLLPAFRRVVSRQELDALGIWSARSRAELDGVGMYKSLRTELARLEQAAGIANLNRLVPPF